MCPKISHLRLNSRNFKNCCYLLAILCEHFVSKEVDIPQLEENNGVHLKLQIFWRIFVTHQTSESRKTYS